MKKLKAGKLDFKFEDQEDFPDLTFDVSLGKHKINKKINVIIKKKNVRRDPSTRLF